ncbi:MAG: hypothetical protein M3021_07710 [Actinomycetota bacterium]|nr:hypothetical protein [Actinomycetota bacterium]
MAAHELSRTSFGAYSLAFYGYGICVGISYAVGGEPFQVRFSHGAAPGLVRSAGQVLGTAIAVAGLGTAIMVLLGVVVVQLRGPFVVAGVALPGLLVQDAVRQIYFAEGRPSWASLNDGIWVGVSAAAVCALLVTGTAHTATFLMAAWAAGAWIAGAVGLAHLRITPRPFQFPAWLRENRSLAVTFVVDFVSMTGAGQLVIYLLPLIVSLAAVGSMRGAYLLYGPLTVAMAGSRLFGIPEGVRILRNGALALRRFEFLYGGCVSTLAVIYLVGLHFIPTVWGQAVLGANWAGTSPLLFWIGVAMVGSAMAVAPFQGLRVLKAGRRILWARLFDAPVTIVLSVLGALGGGVRGAAAGIALAKVVAASAWWVQFLRATADHGQNSSAAAPAMMATDSQRSRAR